MVKFLQKYFKKGITSILILSIFSSLVLPFSIIYAQEYSTGGGYGSSGGSYPSNTGITGGIGARISAITPLLSELPLCADKIGVSKVKGLFREASSLLKTKSGEDGSNTVDKAENNPLSESLAIEVIDVSGGKKLDKSNEKLNDINKSTAETNENDTCLKSVGRLVTKMLLQKITVSTVEWINNGFEGKPLFLQDPGKFFGDIAKNEFLQFKLEIDDPYLYPFGRNFLKNQVLGLNRRFSDNARYSLNELIQETTPQYDAISFGANFSHGGWAAWDALTQVPANNPLGFNIIASTELSARLKGTSFSKGEEVQNSLDQSGGFLGDERCADPEGLTRAEHNAAIIKGEKEYEGSVYDNDRDGIPDDIDGSVNIDPNDNDGDGVPNGVDSTPNHEIKGQYTGYIIGTCKKWEYVTPGKLIAESATKVIGYPDNNILAADDLNSAIAAIMDALLNRWTADIANKGFANFNTEGSNGAFIYDDDNRTTGAYGQVELDFPKSFTNSSWLRENPDFNIRTDLTQALIDEQRIYQQRLKDENEVLEDLIITVRQLDYCIPGPHPGWEEDSEKYLANEMKKIPSKTLQDFDGDAGQQILEGVTIGLLNQFTSGIGGSVFKAFKALTGTEPYQLLSKYYAGIIIGLTGISIDKKDTYISNKSEITSAFETMLGRYNQLIKKHYTRDFLPQITPQARIEFRKISGYEQKIDNNEYAIYTLTGIINRLSKLKDQLDELDQETTEYETYLPMINEFGRLSASMVTGNDIARLIDDLKEEEDQIKYVYNDLLTGPYGCEAELSKSELVGNPTDLLRKTLRANYPFDILYDYNKLSKNQKIPSLNEPNDPQDNELGIFAIAKYNINKNPDNTMPSYHEGPFIDKTNTRKVVYPVSQNPDGSPVFGLIDALYYDIKDDGCEKPNTEPKNNQSYQDVCGDQTSTAYGPGFLSSVLFNFETEKEEAVDCRDFGEFNDTEGVAAKKNVLDCLKVSDLFIGVNRWPVTVGRKQGGPVTNTSQVGEGPLDLRNRNEFTSFEQLIGIY